MSPYPILRQRLLERLPVTDPADAVQMLHVCVSIANQANAQMAVLQMIADGCQVWLVEEVVATLEARCGDVLAELRTVLEADKQIAALAGVGAPAVLRRLQAEFFQG